MEQNTDSFESNGTVHASRGGSQVSSDASFVEPCVRKLSWLRKGWIAAATMAMFVACLALTKSALPVSSAEALTNKLPNGLSVMTNVSFKFNGNGYRLGPKNPSFGDKFVDCPGNNTALRKTQVEARKPVSLQEIMARALSLRLFEAYANKTDVTEELAGQGPFTLFPP